MNENHGNATRVRLPPAFVQAISGALVSTGVSAILVAVLVLIWEKQHSYGIACFDDIFDKIRLYETSGSTIRTLKQIFALHNEHRIATTRMLMVADERLAGGREMIPIVASNILQMLSALLCILGVLQRFGKGMLRSGEAFALSGLVFLMFINPNLLETLDLPFQVQHAIMGFLAVLTAWQVAAAVDRPSSRRETALLLIRLVTLAIVASVTLGNAPVLLMASFAAAILFRWGWRLTVVLGALAAAHTIIILATTPGVGAVTRDPGAILEFTILYLGSPFVRIMAWPAGFVTWSTPVELAKVAGWSVLALPAAFALLQIIAPRRNRALAAFGFTLCAIVVVTALAAGYSRSQFGIEAASDKKYASFAALGWVGCLALALGLAQELRRFAAPVRIAVVLAMYVAVLPFSVVALDREERIWGNFMNGNWLAATAIYTGVGDSTVLRGIYPEPERLLEYANDIEVRGRGIFSRYPFRMGDSVSAVTNAAVEVPCKSEVEGVDGVPDQDLAYPPRISGTPVKINGWTWMTTLREPADAVVAINPEDRVAGLAHPVSLSHRAELWLGQIFTQQLGWAGYAVSDAVHDLRYVALSRDGHYYCLLGRQGDVR